MFRLADVPSDTAEADALYRRVCDRSGELSKSNLASQLPEAVAELLLGTCCGQRQDRPFVLPVGPMESITTLALTLDVLADGPVRRRDTLEAVRGLYADDLKPR